MGDNLKQFYDFTYHLDELIAKMCISSKGSFYVISGYDIVRGKTEEVEEKYGLLKRKTRKVEVTTPTYISNIYGKFAHNVKSNSKAVWGDYDGTEYDQETISALIDMFKNDRDRYLKLKSELSVFGAEIVAVKKAKSV